MRNRNNLVWEIWCEIVTFWCEIVFFPLLVSLCKKKDFKCGKKYKLVKKLDGSVDVLQPNENVNHDHNKVSNTRKTNDYASCEKSIKNLLSLDVKTRIIRKDLKDNNLIAEDISKHTFQQKLYREKKKLSQAAVKINYETLKEIIEVNSGAPRDVNVTANGHFVPIGVCLTNREDTETFEFLFKWIKESATNAPYALMSDADMASRNAAVNIFGDKLVLLMCYYHQKKAVKRKLQFVKEKDETVFQSIMNDIHMIHLFALDKPLIILFTVQEVRLKNICNETINAGLWQWI